MEEPEIFQSDVDIGLGTDFVPFKNSKTIGTALYSGMQVLAEHKALPHTASKLLQRAKDLALIISAPKDPSLCSLRYCAIASNSTDTELAFIFNLPQSLPIIPSHALSSPQFTSLRDTFLSALALRPVSLLLSSLCKAWAGSTQQIGYTKISLRGHPFFIHTVWPRLEQPLHRLICFF